MTEVIDFTTREEKHLKEVREALQRLQNIMTELPKMSEGVRDEQPIVRNVWNFKKAQERVAKERAEHNKQLVNKLGVNKNDRLEKFKDTKD